MKNGQITEVENGYILKMGGHETAYERVGETYVYPTVKDLAEGIAELFEPVEVAE